MIFLYTCIGPWRVGLTIPKIDSSSGSVGSAYRLSGAQIM